MGKSKLYDKNDINELSLKRDLVTLQPLLWNIKEEEKNVIRKYKSILEKDIDFKSSFFASSKGQIYKTYSILGLVKYHDRSTKYYVLDLALFLDIWYNHALISKDKLLNCDILIIHGLADPMNAEYKATALIELASIRKTMQRLTWLFIEGSSTEEFEKLYPNVTKSFGKIHSAEF